MVTTTFSQLTSKSFIPSNVGEKCPKMNTIRQLSLGDTIKS